MIPTSDLYQAAADRLADLWSSPNLDAYDAETYATAVTWAIEMQGAAETLRHLERSRPAPDESYPPICEGCSEDIPADDDAFCRRCYEGHAWDSRSQPPMCRCCMDNIPDGDAVYCESCTNHLSEHTTDDCPAADLIHAYLEAVDRSTPAFPPGRALRDLREAYHAL